jgi:DNA (cytosine-5)-methyltransferase 1
MENLNELALFAGAGGGILGGHLLGWRTVCAVEWEQYPASVLCARQNDGLLPTFPIWDDVQTFDGKPWRGIVDVVSGGFPCQDISSAGKGEGIGGGRSSMWKHMARIIGEVQPRYAFVENSPMLTTRGLGTVLGDLASLGFNAEWGVLSAANVGANHKRDRIWIVGKNTKQSRFFSHSMHNGNRRGKQQSESIEETHGAMANAKEFFSNGIQNNSRKSMESKKKSKPRNCNGSENVSNSTSIRLQGQGEYEQSINSTQSRNWKTVELKYGSSSDFWKTEPNVGRVVDGMAFGVDRLKAIGNGQVPLCAATAWRLLNERI